jgi:hypothetical protein
MVLEKQAQPEREGMADVAAEVREAVVTLVLQIHS